MCQLTGNGGVCGVQLLVKQAKRYGVIVGSDGVCVCVSGGRAGWGRGAKGRRGVEITTKKKEGAI